MLNKEGRERVALGSQASEVTTEVVPAAAALAIQLGRQYNLLPTTSAGVPKLQPAEDPQHRGCSTLPATDLTSHLQAHWGVVTPAPMAAWDGQARSAPADTLENQQLLHRKTDSIRRPWFCPTDLQLQTLPLDTSWVLFTSHELHGRMQFFVCISSRSINSHL